MWSSTPRLLLGLCGLLCAVGSASADVDFMSVRPDMVKDYSGKGGEPGEKYFKESSFHYHYDGRFADEPLSEEETVPHLSELIRTYLSTMADLGAETWIMHGTLLAWWWNQKIFPWDNDLDVQISEPTIHFLADYYNMTEHHFEISGVDGGRTYLLEINPNYVVRSTDDKLNVIDARWIDTSSGLFIDITAVRKDDERREKDREPGALMCKDGHRFDETEIFPLRNSYFEDVPVKIPFEYVRLLKKEYGSKSMTASVFQGYHFNQQTQVWDKMRRLEGVIEHLSEKKATGAAASSSDTSSPRVQQHPQNPPAPPANAQASAPEGDGDGCPLLMDAAKLDPTRPIAPRNIEHEFGRLVIDEGRSRYVSNRFWASLGDEIEELQDILDPSSSDEEDYSSPETSSSQSANHDGFLFGFYSVSHSLHDFLPPRPQIPLLWNTWLENVAPLIPIVHKASARQLFTTAAQDPNCLDKNFEALFLAMCMVAIISMSPSQCSSHLGEERDVLVKRYRFAVEQALSKADLLNTQNITLLQAVVIFLIGVRREDDTKFVWSMTALVLRLAQGLGLHRDGTNFGLKPYETEIRRRLWWHICLLDIRAAEDHGSDAQIHERLYDTRLPLNINDDDITPDMKEPPKERVGWTEMTFCLIRCDITVAVRRVSYTCPNGHFVPATRQLNPDNCSKMIRAINDRIEDRYIKHCDMNVPIQWVCATIGRLILTKLWLVIHHPMTRPERGLTLSHANRESLFATSVEVAEFQRLLDGDVKTYKWSWLFATNMQWHAIAFVLSELCVRPLSPLTDRAWKCVSTLYTEWIKNSKQRKGMLWRPLSRLMKRAAAFRAKQEEMRAQMSSSMIAAHDAAIPNCPGLSIIQPPVLPRALDFQASPTGQEKESLRGLPENGGIDIDLRGGPVNVINELFPDTDWLNPATAASIQQQECSGASMDTLVRPTEPSETQQEMPNANLNWEEWDQVMTDFQMDLQASNTQNPFGNALDWLA
nr:Zn(II)2Cys6 transcription factor [Aspergillus niger CBS 513.88]|eukprot:XP_001398851.2 Zn(II)2Cys6 transcription factor [Aspergillus niger CBS 513.88]